MIKGKVGGVLNVSRVLGKTLPDNMRKALAKTVRTEAKGILSDIQSSIPVKTGALKASLKVRTSGKGLTARIGTWAKDRAYIARFLEFGTKPHTIKATKGKVLALGNGFAKSVRHPGAKPRDFLLDKTLARRKAFAAIVRQAILEVLKQAGR